MDENDSLYIGMNLWLNSAANGLLLPPIAHENDAKFGNSIQRGRHVVAAAGARLLSQGN